MKKKVKKTSKTPKDPPKPATEVVVEKENLFDFGGLPPRDLKKNLGCG